MEPGYLPDFEGKPVLASCGNCEYCVDQSEGPEYAPSFYECEKPGREHVSTLKGFPFKTPQKCCKLAYWHMIDWKAEERRIAAEEI